MTMRNLIAVGLLALFVFPAASYAESDRASAPAFRSPITTASAEKPAKEQKGKLKRAKNKQAANAKAKPALAKRRKSAERQLASIEPLVPVQLASGNTGELRSEGATAVKPDLFGGLFGRRQQTVAMLPQTRALDEVLEKKQARKKFKVRSEFEPQSVDFDGGYRPGTIVIDSSARYLYLVESRSSARRYAIAVGREGLEFKGAAKVGDKQEWPRWIPTLDMQKREPKKYGQYKDGMNGGPENPLGARAIYLYQNGRDTHVRIHGTNQPQTIGTNSSNGCFRMVNEHVMDLYSRVKMGTEVIVM
jgi:lipoprotein-anchoring transpeptidase ErfK/SrfK